MQSRKWSMDSYRDEEREQAWSDALLQICLPTARVQDHDGFHGDVCSVVSPLGIELARVSSSAQTLSGSCVSQTPCLWLALPLVGEFQLEDGGSPVTLRPGDILYGPTGNHSTLSLPDHFAMLYLRIPQTLLHPRLLNLKVLSVGILSRQAAVDRIFVGLLRSIVNELEQLNADEIRPIEVAISEFVVASLAENSAASCFDVVSASNFRRICQAIEIQLGNGDLSLQHVSEQQRVSARYIQKLFQQANLSFSQYLRQRRLEHCRADLASSTHRHLSISDICFRWGFNDAAHFSRSFRLDYGTSPRAYRRQQSAQPS